MTIKILKKGVQNEKRDAKGKLIKREKLHNHIEYLSCGHMNNLKLSGRQSGVCPKGDI